MEIDFISTVHKKTARNYLERVIQNDKAECALVAKKFGFDYWDGDRKYGYGGFRYDGRWRPVAQQIAQHYQLRPGQRVLDVGCGKAFLLYEFTQVVPGLQVAGIDVSRYGLEHAKEEVRPYLVEAPAQKIPFPDQHFDLVISINTLHNLPIYDLQTAMREIVRVGKGPGYVVVESYRNESEKANLLYWQLTCESFYSPQGWEWIYRQCGYRGDHSFIYFE